MEFISYKTNISDEVALSQVIPFLNNAIGSSNWQIDLDHADHILTVFSPDMVDEERVVLAVRKGGFKAMNFEDYYSIF